MTEWLTLETLAGAAAWVLLFAGFSAAGAVAFPRKAAVLTAAARAIALISLVLLAAGFALRWQGYAASMGVNPLKAFPVSTFYEAAVFAGMLAAALALGLGKKLPDPAPQAAVLLLAAGAILAAGLVAPTAAVPFMPTLKNYWLVSHVSMSFIAYALYFIAAVAGLHALFARKAEQCAPLVRSLLGFATFVFGVGGILFGAVWAQHSWGRFWGWDPKETWALITWTAYLFIIHADRVKKLSSKALCLSAALAFSAVLFTFLGVNLLFGGLHAYGAL